MITNVQSDEPSVSPADLTKLIKLFDMPGGKLSGDNVPGDGEAADEWVHQGFARRYEQIAAELKWLMSLHGVFGELEAPGHKCLVLTGRLRPVHD